MAAPRNVSKPHSRAHRGGSGGTGPRAALIDLPAAGCDLPVPKLPKSRAWTAPERARWKELWSSPQATQWDDSVIGTVAVLVVYEQAILSGSASAWMAQEARYAAEALGLTPKAMAALGWRITE